MTSGHNKGPIGPLDPDEPPSFPYDNLQGHHILTIAEATRAARAMRVKLRDRDVERYIAEGNGPPYTVVGSKIVIWDEFKEWLSRTYPKEGELTREEAVEYLRSIGCPISDSTLQQMRDRGPPYRFVGDGLKVWYPKEGLDKWWAERKATWRTTTSKYRPSNYDTRCPEFHRDKGHCPNIKHERCAKYPRALCNIIHLPVRPGSQEEWLPAMCGKIIDGKLVCYRVIDGKMVIVKTLERIEGKWVVVKTDQTGDQ